MRRVTMSAALAALAIAAGAPAPASAQLPAAPQPYVVYGRPYVVYQATPGYYYRPAPTYYYRPTAPLRRGDSRAVLPGFAPRGGIGTTPFLGNTRGLGAFSTNYDAR